MIAVHGMVDQIQCREQKSKNLSRTLRIKEDV